jgi:hypothetical protein
VLSARVRYFFAATLLTACGMRSGVTVPVHPDDAKMTGAPSIAVRGNEFVTTTTGRLGVQWVGAGVAVVLRGVNLSGAEYACLQQHSVWDDPKGDAATVTAMLGRGIRLAAPRGRRS